MARLDLGLLGSFRLMTDSDLSLPNKKAQALLAYLALPPGRMHRRDKLAALLWGEHEAEAARHSLRQCLSTIRKVAEPSCPDVIVSTRDMVALNSAAVAVDVARLERLIAEATPAALNQALVLYRGDLLDGLDPRELRFAEWLFGERRRLHETAIEAFGRLLNQQIEGGDGELAIMTALRLLALDPVQETIHRKLMGLYFEQGRTDAALRQYRDCAKMLRRELDVEPDAETKRLAQRIRRGRSDVPEPPPDASAALELPDKPSIAVLPFDNPSGDPEQDYFADGITEDIITALSRVRWLFVIARNSSFSFKGRAVEAAPIARDLGVRYVVEGSVRKSGSHVRITAQLIDGSSGNQVWAKRYDRELADIFEVQDDLTERIVGALEPELGKAERARAKRKRPGNLDAWDLYQRGLSHLYRYTREELVEARRLFEQAIAKDPQLGPALSGLAEVYYYSYVYGLAESLDECRERALPLARRAVGLDSEDASAHCTLGRVLYMRREHEAAIPELDMALELNPSLALAHYGLGAVLVFSGAAEASIPHLERAIRLSPRDPNMGSFMVRLADAQLFMGRHEEAIGWARRALGQTGFQWSRYAVLLSALGHLGRAEEAKRVLNDVLTQRPDFSRRFVRATHLISDEADFDHYIEGLREAAVPA